MDEKKRKAAIALKRDPKYTVQEICGIVGISRNTTTNTRALGRLMEVSAAVKHLLHNSRKRVMLL